MTDLATALANVDLGEFEGSTVLGTAIDIPNAGGGLHAALKIQPVVLHKGQRVKVLIDAEVGNVSFVPVKDTDGVTRTHRLIAVGATIVDGTAFDEALAKQAEEIRVAQEAAKGIQGLPFDAAELEVKHSDGAHADGLIPGCPQCDQEVAAGESEAVPGNVEPISGRRARKS